MQFLHQTPEIAGLLYKRRGGFGKFAPNAWQYRFFAISKEGVLLYFDTETQDVEHSDSKARGRLDLRSVMYEVSTEPIEGSPTPYAIQLFVPNEEKWKLCADTKEDQARWCKILSKFVNQEAKTHNNRGILSYTSDDENDRPRRDAVRRNTVTVTSSSTGRAAETGLDNNRHFSTPATAPITSNESSNRSSSTPPVTASSMKTSSAAAAAKKKAKLSSSSASKAKDTDQFELILILLIINICFLGIYQASSIISTLFYVFLGNLVMGVTLQLRAGRGRLIATADAVAAHIVREESGVGRELYEPVAEVASRSRGASELEEAGADRRVIQSMASLSSEGGAVTVGKALTSSGKPLAGIALFLYFFRFIIANDVF